MDKGVFFGGYFMVNGISRSENGSYGINSTRSPEASRKSGQFGCCLDIFLVSTEDLGCFGCFFCVCVCCNELVYMDQNSCFNVVGSA